MSKVVVLSGHAGSGKTAMLALLEGSATHRVAARLVAPSLKTVDENLMALIDGSTLVIDECAREVLEHICEVTYQGHVIVALQA